MTARPSSAAPDMRYSVAHPQAADGRASNADGRASVASRSSSAAAAQRPSSAADDGLARHSRGLPPRPSVVEPQAWSRAASPAGDEAARPTVGHHRSASAVSDSLATAQSHGDLEVRVSKLERRVHNHDQELRQIQDSAVRTDDLVAAVSADVDAKVKHFDDGLLALNEARREDLAALIELRGAVTDRGADVANLKDLAENTAESVTELRRLQDQTAENLRNFSADILETQRADTVKLRELEQRFTTQSKSHAKELAEVRLANEREVAALKDAHAQDMAAQLATMQRLISEAVRPLRTEVAALKSDLETQRLTSAATPTSAPAPASRADAAALAAV